MGDSENVSDLGLLGQIRRSMMFSSTPAGAALGYPNISGLGMLLSNLGGEKRQPYSSENAYFKKNPTVAGMATEDNKITLNPYSPLSMTQKQAVAVNEAARLLLRGKQLDFPLTTQQHSMLSNTTYANADEQSRKATILARLLSGDSSAGKPTDAQTISLMHLLLNARR